MRFLNLIKLLLKELITFFNFILSLALLPIYILKLKNKKKFFFFQYEGGFGHTITTPLLLQNEFNKEWLLILLYEKNRHNKSVLKIFKKNLILIPCSVLFNKSKYFYRYKFFVIFKFLSKLILKKEIIDYHKFLFTKKFDNNVSNNYLKTYESRCWTSIVKSSEVFTFSNNHKYQINNFKKKFNYSKLIYFQLRYKGKKNFYLQKIKDNDTINNLDLSNILRDSRPIEDYKKILEDLANKGYTILINGDIELYPSWVEYNDKIISYKKLHMDKKYFNFISGISADILIGQASGGMMYSMFNKINNFFLETYEIGTGYYNTIVSYPRIKSHSLKELSEILVYKNFLWEKNFFSENIKEFSNNELFEIYLDYIENYKKLEYGITPQKIGIKSGMLIESKSKISNKWLELLGF